MHGASEVLWRVNNEYRKRLSQTQTFLDLLEQMLLMHESESRQEHVLTALRYAREQVAVLIEEHRRWRHMFYYDSPDSKRMVQTDRAVNQALARFNKMRGQHEARLIDLYNVLYHEITPPDASFTRVPNGDLWEMSQYAFHDLINFGDYLSDLVEIP